MIFSRILFTATLLLVLAPASAHKWSGRRTAIVECPILTADCDRNGGCCGPVYRFRATLKGSGSADRLTYSWTVSRGKLREGQGTSSITVDAGGENGGAPLTATVSVESLGDGCPNAASISVSCDPHPEARFYDSFENLPSDEEQKRLDRFAGELRKDSRAAGYIVVYGGRGAPENAAYTDAQAAKRYLVNGSKIDAERIVILEGGKHLLLTMALYVVPPGALPPIVCPPKGYATSGAERADH